MHHPVRVLAGVEWGDLPRRSGERSGIALPAFTVAGVWLRYGRALGCVSLPSRMSKTVQPQRRPAARGFNPCRAQ